jgi:hypothetical protein
MDFVDENRKIYWNEIKVNEVKRNGMNGGVNERIIEKGIEKNKGFEIEWI